MLLACYLNDLLQTASLTHTTANVDDVEIVHDNAKALPNFQSDSWNKRQRMVTPFISSSSSTTNQRIKRPQRRRQSSRNRWDSMGREPKDPHSTRSSSPTTTITTTTTTKSNRTGASLQKPTMPTRRVSIDKEELSPVSVTTIAEMVDKSYVEYPKDSKPSGLRPLRMPVRRVSVDKESIPEYILGSPVF